MLFSTTGKPGNGERGESQPWGTGAGRLNCRAEGGGGGWIQGQSQRGYCPLGLGSSPQPTRPIPVDPSPSVWQFGPWAPLRVLCVWAGALAGLSLLEPVWFRWLQGHRRRLPQTLASRPPLKEHWLPLQSSRILAWAGDGQALSVERRWEVPQRRGLEAPAISRWGRQEGAAWHCSELSCGKQAALCLLTAACWAADRNY